MIDAKNYAELRSIGPSYTGTTVNVAGRDFAGDGNGGKFTLIENPASLPFVPFDDDGCIIQSPAGFWRRDIEYCIRPEWYGMRVTSANNFPAIQAALDAAFLLRKNTVIMPPCNGKTEWFYGIGTLDTSGVNLIGAGNGYGGTRIIRQGDANTSAIIQTGKKNGLSVFGSRMMDFWCDTEGDSDRGIYAFGDSEDQPDNIHIERVRFSAFQASGTWFRPTELDGSARSTSPLGIRQATIADSQLFASRNLMISAFGVMQLRISKIVAPASGSIVRSDGYWPGVWIGGPSSNFKSFNNDVEMSKCGGRLTVNGFVYSFSERANRWTQGYAISANANIHKSSDYQS